MSAPVHFLHIRKTGGMALKAALSPVAAERGLLLREHGTTLAKVPKGERVVFVVRDPVSRFVSGFNSRLRMGRPLFDRPWNAAEAQAFAAFKTPDELALALDARAPAALAAMAGIRHVNQPLSDWLVSETYLRDRLGDIVWVGRTETLAADLEEIKRRLDLPQSVRLPEDEVSSHRTPHGMQTQLSSKGRAALERWYEADLRMLAFLERVRKTLRK
ncbi:MAG TPA: sulfotransferase family 2 domain-containing protein [Rhizomicrobium sp.]|nr:sulfotransferase family 2 domain-containing protein [Rhizomicrobium sp.]